MESESIVIIILITELSLGIIGAGITCLYNYKKNKQ